MYKTRRGNEKAHRPEQTQHTLAMIAYRSKQPSQNQRTEYKPRYYPENFRPQTGGLRFSQIFGTICKKPGHTNNQCRFRKTRIKQPYQRSRPRVEAHLAEEISEDESYPTETNNEKIDDGYEKPHASFPRQSFNSKNRYKTKI